MNRRKVPKVNTFHGRDVDAYTGVLGFEAIKVQECRSFRQKLVQSALSESESV